MILSSLQSNINKLNSFRDLPDNWNGIGGEKIDNDVINTSLSIIPLLSHQPHVFPTGRGSVQLEYEKKNGDYLEFEIFKDKRIEMFLSTSDNEISKEIKIDEIVKYVNEFFDMEVGVRYND